MKNSSLELPNYKYFVLASKIAIVFAVLAGVLKFFYDGVPVLTTIFNLINTVLFLYLIYGIKRYCLYKNMAQGVPFNLFISFSLLLLVIRTPMFFWANETSLPIFIKEAIEHSRTVVIIFIIVVLLVAIITFILWFKLGFRLKAKIPEYGIGTLFITYALAPIVLAISSISAGQDWVMDLIFIIEVFLLVEIKKFFESKRNRGSNSSKIGVGE